jgi:hypothetical protein
MAMGFIPTSASRASLLASWTLERVLIFAGGLLLVGFIGLVWCISVWASSGFGPLQYAALLRILVLSLTAIAAAIQLSFTAFLAGIMEIPTRHRPVSRPGADR